MALIEDMSKNLAPARRYATSVKEARALYEKSITDLRALQPNLQAVGRSPQQHSAI